MNRENTRTVSLTLTQNCNLSCSYCYEHHKSLRTMDFQTAKKIIDMEFASRESDVTAFEFDLFGGEPFLEFPLIKEITEYICSKKGELPCTIFATTNGTLVHGDVQDWLAAHKQCFICGLSLDGTKIMHDLNRSYSYDQIDIPFFLNNYPEQDVKMTISEATLPMLSEGVIHLHELGFLVSCNLGYEISWNDPNNAVVLEKELSTLIEYYLSHPNVRPCSMLDMDISNIVNSSDEVPRYCGAGIYMAAYDVDGKKYPCQFFMPLSIGENLSTNVDQIVFPGESISKQLLDTKCQTCAISASCPNCFGANYFDSKNIYHRKDDMCYLTKIIFRARSYFRGRQWANGQLHLDFPELQSMLKAIQIIQTELLI